MGRTTSTGAAVSPSTQERLKFLAKLRLFKPLPQPEHAALADAMVPQSFEPGQVIIKEGDEGNVFYASLSMLSDEARKKLLRAVETSSTKSGVANVLLSSNGASTPRLQRAFMRSLLGRHGIHAKECSLQALSGLRREPSLDAQRLDPTSAVVLRCRIGRAACGSS